VTRVPVIERAPPRPSGPVAADTASRSALRRHAPLAALLAAGAALRALAVAAVYPGIWFSDSNGYVQVAVTGRLGIAHVDGYSLFVAPFWRLHSAGALIVTQHVLGLGIVALLYALLVRRGAPPWLAALGVLPAALDAYVVDLEHMIMSETVLAAAIVGGLALLLWPDRPRLAGAAGAGLLLGYAAVVRSVATPFVVLVVAYLLTRRVGWRPVAAFAVGWALVAGGYASLFHHQTGHFGFTRFGGRYLYAQVAPFADCARLSGLPADERRFCPDPRHRLTTNGYLWAASSPIHHLPAALDGRVHDFAMRVVRTEPLRYAGVVGGNLVHYFEPGHHTGRNDYSPTAWQFPADPRRWSYPGYRGPIRPGTARAHGTKPNQYIAAFAAHPRVNVGPSRFLHGYQRFAYASGQVLAPCLLVILVALVRRRLRLDAALLAAMGLATLFVASVLSLFDYRYELGAVVLLPAAAVLAVSGRPRPRTPR
jgi:hypothetical protein